jgi:hypothetical protein
MAQKNSMDRWEKALDIEIEKLKECQSQKGLDSCFKCKEVLDCKIRDSYVKAVYESMNKGQGGGFEF